MNLSDTRTLIADGVTAGLSGMELTPGNPVIVHPKRSAVSRFGNGWVVFVRMVPARFGGVYLATFRVIVLLSTDDVVAEELLDQLSVPLCDVIGETLNATPTEVTPLSLFIDGAEFYALAVTLILEVEGS